MVTLPGLRLADVEANVAALLEAFDDELPTMTMRRHRREVTSRILGWLWDAAVAPVLATLPADAPVPPRVWWLPTGLLGLLPLPPPGTRDSQAPRRHGVVLHPLTAGTS